MIKFKELFKKSTEYPLAINYIERRIFIADKFPISNKDTLIISIEETKGKYTQDVAVGIYGYCKLL